MGNVIYLRSCTGCMPAIEGTCGSSLLSFRRRIRENMCMGSQGNPYLERGIAFKIDGRYEEAASELTQLLTEDPNSSDGQHQLGLVYGFTGDFDESLVHLQRAVPLAPARIDMRTDLA